MEEAMRALRQQRPNYDTAAELQEPATQEFVVDSLAAMMESPSEEKRELLGRFIAKRLYMATESSEELSLRQAEATAQRMNRRHLYALATLYLVHYTPVPTGLSRQEIHAWMDKRLLPVVKVVAETDPSPEELSYLTSLGVVHYDASDTSEAIIATSRPPAIEQNIISATGETLSFGSRFDLGAFYKWAKDLYNGSPPMRGGPNRGPVAPYILTAPGLTIAETVLERFGVDA